MALGCFGSGGDDHEITAQSTNPDEEIHAMSQENIPEHVFEPPIPGTGRGHALASDARHFHPLHLEADQFVDVVVEQQGIDVAVELWTPAGEIALHVDSPIGREGAERLLAVTESSGEHRLVVLGAEPGAPAGKYHLLVAAPRPAEPADRLRAQAERLFSQGEDARREGTETSRRAALESYSEALEIFRQSGPLDRQADTLHRLGWTRSLLGENLPARERFSAALELYRQLGERRGAALALNSRALANWDLGATEDAMADVRAALLTLRDPAAPRLDAPSIVAGVLNNLGMLHRRRGEVEDALAAYREGLTLAQSRGDLSQEAQILGNLGRLLISQGKLEVAADRLRESNTILEELGDPRRQGTGLIFLGDVLKRMAVQETDPARSRTLYDDAEDAYARALELKRQAGDRRGEAVALNSLGTVRLLLGEFETSRKAFEEAGAIYRELDNPRGQALTLFNLGRLHQSRNDPRQALADHQDAAPFLATFDDPQLEGSNRYGMALAHRDLGELEKAQDEVEGLIASVENLRESTDREAMRMAFFATKQQYYELAVDIRMRRHAALLGVDPDQEAVRIEGESHHLTEAFSLAERGRARALLDLLGEDREAIRDDAPSDLLRRERRLQDDLNAAAAARAAVGDGTRTPQDLEIEKRRLRDELDAVRAEIRRSSPRTALTRPEAADLEQVRKHLVDRHSQWLIYSLGERYSYLLLLDPIDSSGGPRRPPIVHRLPGRADLESAALKANRLLTAHSSHGNQKRIRHLAELSETLLGPIADRLTAPRLVVVAEGALLYLPFAALPKPPAAASDRIGSDWAEPGHEMLRDHELIHLPSASVLRTLRKQLAGRHPAAKQIAVFADPVYRSSEGGPGGSNGQIPDDLARSAADVGLEEPDPLPGTRVEAQAILDLARGDAMPSSQNREPRVRGFLGFDASKRNALEGGLADYQILHFATHGMLNRSHPELSGLMLSLFDEQGRPQDGFLRLHEIYNLRLNAELVVLSACRTGLGADVRGEGLVGLSRGFMYAGVPRMVVSLWKVGDHSTAELMQRFYWSLLEAGAPPATALRAAQLSLLDSDDKTLSHPDSWAGFVFQGDWRLFVEDDTDDSIETAATGGGEDDDEDIGYPGPPWCDDPSLEPWQRRVCAILQDLATGGGR